MIPVADAAPVLAFRDQRSAGPVVVEVGFTDRRWDLGDRADAAVREAGLEALRVETGAAARIMRQVHGATVHVFADLAPTEPPEADALVTSVVGLALLARAADCVPVLLADVEAGVVAAVHAGRPGVVAGVVPAAVASMRQVGAGELTAWVGPHVCGACYEVPAAMRDEVAAVAPAAWATTSWGTPSLDIGAAVTAQLVAAGCEVVAVDRCTREDPGLPSYRRDGAAAGRFAGVVWRSS
ncbi:MAG: polyphenol oxidase family protein [Nocardioidaceae bacterium]